MKKSLKNLRDLSTTYEVFVALGFLMVVATLAKLLGFVNISSDWFWFIAGIGLMVEGSILLRKQKQFDKDCKVVSRE